MPIQETTVAEERAYLRNWAADNKCALDEGGEIGFGRDCVGIKYGTHFVGYDYDDREANPPLEVEDAYHKSPALAILGLGDEKLHQLYLWVKQLETRGYIVIERPRVNLSGSVVETMLHGYTEPILQKRETA